MLPVAKSRSAITSAWVKIRFDIEMLLKKLLGNFANRRPHVSKEKERQVTFVLRHQTVRGFKKLGKASLDTVVERHYLAISFPRLLVGSHCFRSTTTLTCVSPQLRTTRRFGEAWRL